MRRLFVLSLAFVAGFAVRETRAQAAAPPVELGLDVSATIVPERSGFQRGPRFLVNFDGHNAVQFTASLQELSSWEDFGQKETDLYRPGLRFSGGLVVPVGSYPSPAHQLDSPAPWAGLDPGERAWVTTTSRARGRR